MDCELACDTWAFVSWPGRAAALAARSPRDAGEAAPSAMARRATESPGGTGRRSWPSCARQIRCERLPL
ncbi:hypothetical protein PJP10_27960 [Mycobacterium kansasii]